jgi:ABC-type phosphate transport system permease subunit
MQPSRRFLVILSIASGLRFVLWAFCFVSVRSDASLMHRALLQAQSAVQENATIAYAAIKIAIVVVLAFILDKPLSIPWKLYLARGTNSPSVPFFRESRSLP